MASFIVDAHALIWFLGKNPRLGTAAREAISDPNSILFLPAVALAEVLWIVKSRSLGVTIEAVLSAIDKDERITIVPLSREIVVAAHGLPGNLEMHDCQIVATAIHLGETASPLPVLSIDQDIVSSGLVPIVW